MRKLAWVGLTFALAFGSLSCATSAVYTNEQTLVSAEIAYLTSVSPQNRISFQIPCFQNEKTDALVRDYVAQTMNRTCGLDVPLSLCEEDIDVTGDYTEYGIDVDCNRVYISDEVVSMTFEGTCNRKHAAHPTQWFFSLNVDPETGERLLLKDVYRVDDALYEVFSEYACKALAEKAEEQWFDGVDFAELCPKERFLQGLQSEETYYAFFSQTGIGIVYPVPHAIGDYQVVEIPYNAVAVLRLS